MKQNLAAIGGYDIHGMLRVKHHVDPPVAGSVQPPLRRLYSYSLAEHLRREHLVSDLLKRDRLSGHMGVKHRWRGACRSSLRFSSLRERAYYTVGVVGGGAVDERFKV